MNDNIQSSRYVILRLRQVSARTGLARSTIYERIKAGEFPSQVSLGARAVGWLEADISAWIAAQVERSRKGQATVHPACLRKP
jgi:prophage regulatory protein